MNRAHGPALTALRQADTRPRVEIRLHVQGTTVSVRGDGLKFDGTYAAPVTLHALVHGIAPLAEAYWLERPQTPPEIRRLVARAKRTLGRKHSDLRPAHTWWDKARSRY